MGHFVEVSGVPTDVLELLGWVLIEETEEFRVFIKKGELFIVDKTPPSFIFVDDYNDVPILRSHSRVPAPPKL